MILFGGEWRTFEAHQQKLHDERDLFTDQEWQTSVDELRKAQSRVEKDLADREARRQVQEELAAVNRQVVLVALSWLLDCIKSDEEFDMSYLNETLEDVGLTVDDIDEEHIERIREDIAFDM